jgi:hypothetical protein
MDEAEQGEEGCVEDTDDADHPQRQAVLEPLDRNIEIGLRNELWKDMSAQRAEQNGRCRGCAGLPQIGQGCGPAGFGASESGGIALDMVPRRPVD